MSALINPTTLLLLFFAFVVIPLLRFFKPQIKGWFGEILVHQLLTRRLDQSVYRVVRNVMLPTEDGTTQIDHIVVSRYGIFVIETKNFKGWIFGSERQAKWTQKIFRVTNGFQNPIHQNCKHIKTLAELTDIPEPYFKSTIVFLGDATFKTEMPPCVMYAGDLAKFIRSHAQVIIQDEQVPDIVSAIGEWAGTVSKVSRSQHVARLQQKHGAVSAASMAPACPKCSQPMLLRTRKNDGGRFWGCSTYPRCRGVREVA
jgi:restriction system protein